MSRLDDLHTRAQALKLDSPNPRVRQRAKFKLAETTDSCPYCGHLTCTCEEDTRESQPALRRLGLSSSGYAVVDPELV